MGETLLIHYSEKIKIPNVVLESIAKFFNLESKNVKVYVESRRFARINSLKRRAYWILESLATMQNALNLDDKFSDLLKEANNCYKAFEKSIAAGGNFSSNLKLFRQYLKSIQYLLILHVFPQLRKSHPHLFKQDIDAIVARNLIHYADIYHMQTYKRKVIVTITEASGKGEYLAQIERPLHAFNDEIWKEYLKVNDLNLSNPSWYAAMPEIEKEFFKQSNKKMMKDSTISTKLRMLPGVANFSQSGTLVLRSSGEIINVSPNRYRSSMVVSRDLTKLKLDAVVREKLLLESTVRNIENIIEKHFMSLSKTEKLNHGSISEVPILIQSLISPFKIGFYKYNPDYTMLMIKNKAMDYIRKNGCRIKINGVSQTIKFKHLFDTNHPINIGRHFCGTGRILELNAGQNRQSMEAIISLSAKYPSPVKDAGLQLRKLQNSIPIGGDTIHREMHMAVLEEFIISKIQGISASFCDSGKDRKAIELLYLASFEEFLRVLNRLPELDRVNDREYFAKIYANLFLSAHQELCAGQNSPGSEGIKTAYLFIPRYIMLEIQKQSGNQHIFQESNASAKTNHIASQLLITNFQLILQGLLMIWRYIMTALSRIQHSASLTFFSKNSTSKNENIRINNELNIAQKPSP